MKLLIFGASGKTGRLIVQDSLAKGHTVTAFVRNAKKLVPQKNLRIVEGSLSSKGQLTTAMKGQDVVISALGNKEYNIWHASTAISEALENILFAMERQHVKRLIFITSFGVSKYIFWPEKIFIRAVLRNIFFDIPKQENMIEESGLEWTIVRPSRLTDGKFTGHYKMREKLSIWPWSHISRQDVADFIIKTLETKEWMYKKVTISY